MSTARFEPFDHSELEELKEKEVEGQEQPKILMRKEGIADLLKEARFALEGLNNIQVELQVKTSKIDQQLKTHIIQERAMSLRREMIPAIDERMTIIRKAAATAKEQVKFWSPRSVRVRASFDNDLTKDATIRSVWIRRLEKTHAVFLEEMASYAVATGSLALAHCIEVELDFREGQINECKGEARQTVMRLINSIPTSSAEVLAMLAEVHAIADIAPMAASGKVDPSALIRAGLRKAA